MRRLAALVLPLALGCSDTLEPTSPESGEPEQLVDVVDLNEEKLAGTVDDVEDPGRYAHFYGLTNESLAAFAGRAEERIAMLEHDRLALLSRASASPDAGTRDLLARVSVHLDEARDDLAEVRGQTGGPVFDDGRLGVSLAINRAQRALVAAREQLRARQY